MSSADLQTPGVLDAGYARGREDSRALRYRLARRTAEVRRAVLKHLGGAPRGILDLGTADGRMLRTLSAELGSGPAVGVEYSRTLARIAHAERKSGWIVVGDVQSVPLRAEFDVVVATAVIEHVAEPLQVFLEAYRLLRTNGLLVVTAPDPFWESVSTRIGLLPDDGQHQDVPNLRKMRGHAEAAGLEVLVASKFMLSPIGLPWEEVWEGVLRRLGLGALMANQLLVARKPQSTL